MEGGDLTNVDEVKAIQTPVAPEEEVVVTPSTKKGKKKAKKSPAVQRPPSLSPNPVPKVSSL